MVRWSKAHSPKKGGRGHSQSMVEMHDVSGRSSGKELQRVGWNGVDGSRSGKYQPPIHPSSPGSKKDLEDRYLTLNGDDQSGPILLSSPQKGRFMVTGKSGDIASSPASTAPPTDEENESIEDGRQNSQHRQAVSALAGAPAEGDGEYRLSAGGGGQATQRMDSFGSSSLDYDSYIDRNGRRVHRERGRGLLGSVATEEDGVAGHSTNSVDLLMKENDADYYYVKQRYGYLSIGLSVIQLFVLTVMMALCGVAPLDVNPMVGPYPDALSTWGGKNAYLILESMQFWRFVTPVILHTGVIHLFCNVAVQLETAAFFEREWGSFRWSLIYIISAIGSTVVGCIAEPDSISVGSSGPLLGLFGAKLSEVMCISVFEMERKGGELGNVVRLEQLSGVLCSVAIVSMFSFIPYVDWAAHMGGLATGFVLGMLVFAWYVRSTLWKFFWGGAGLAMLAAGFWFAIKYMFSNVEANEGLADACEYFRRLYVEGYDCACS